ncbi:MAG: choice-of-anchor J domain-containing protein [Bacteroidales bacterium]|nr:choice-of-anchor J domain-containing protein [Bacteroidales bacterium]
MKKIFTLMLALFAMVAVQAQNLLNEDFENGIPSTWVNVDADGDGNFWLSSENETGVSGHNGTNGCAYSCSYISSALTPDNWLITPAITLTGPASLTFWIAAQDANYAAEHYGVYISTTAGTSPADFTLLYEETLDANGGARAQGTWKQKTVNLASYTGTIRIAFRHFNCTDMFYMNIDDVVIFAQPTSPTIEANPTTIDFGTVALGNTASSTVNVTAYSLTTGVTATTTAPFAVSADGTTYGTTATVPAAGGSLYVQYAPTAVGTHNGTVTLASTGATNVTVSVSGNAIDCSNITIPFTEGFESSIDCWTMVSMDPANDARFGVYADAEAYEGSNDFRFSSFSSASDYNQYLITPQLTLTPGQNYIATFYYKGYNANENFKVMYSTTNTDINSFTVLADYTNVATTWTPVTVELPAGTKYVAIDYYGNYQYYLYVDNFSVMPATASMALSDSTLDFGINEMGSTSDAQYVVLSTVSVNEPFTLTTTAPFEVSLNGTTFAATQTIPANASTVVNDTIYVRFAPTAAGTFNQNLTVSSTSFNGTVALTGESVDCTPGITVPYSNDFNSGLVPPVCWSVGDDPENFFSAGTGAEGDYAIGTEAVDFIITPEIHSTDALLVSFDYINYFGTSANAPTYFHVGYSTTDNNASSFTWQGEQLSAVDAFTPYSTVVPAGTKYVAVGVSQLGNGLYYGIFEMDDAFYIDNFALAAQTEPLMNVSPTSMSFGSVNIGSTVPAKTASVVGALLTNDITVTAPANFEVSTNGTSYAATATMSPNGGTLYVRYIPSGAGYHSGNITLTSGSTTKTIAVSGSAVDCSQPQTLPFTENFDNGMPACWSVIDADGDGYTWEPSTEPFSYYNGVDLSGTGYNDSYGFILSGSYSNALGTALTPDNWLITPALVIPSSGATLTFYVAAQDAGYANEHYGVYVSTTGTNPSNFTLLYEEDLDADGGPRAGGTWKQKHVNLPYGNQTIYLAIRHFNCEDMFLIDIDDFSVTAGVGVENHEMDATIYPNPANNVLNINANSNINRVEVYNMMGQMVGSYTANDMNTQINTTSFANGVYTVKISTENGTTTTKFTVAR